MTFVDSFYRTFLAVRLHMARLLALVAIMADAGLPFLKRESLDSLRARCMSHMYPRVIRSCHDFPGCFEIYMFMDSCQLEFVYRLFTVNAGIHRPSFMNHTWFKLSWMAHVVVENSICFCMHHTMLFIFFLSNNCATLDNYKMLSSYGQRIVTWVCAGRFVPDKNEREAAQFMLERIKESQEQMWSTGLSYDLLSSWTGDTEHRAWAHDQHHTPYICTNVKHRAWA